MDVLTTNHSSLQLKVLSQILHKYNLLEVLSLYGCLVS